jgi:ankyrin repeat protein
MIPYIQMEDLENGICAACRGGHFQLVSFLLERTAVSADARCRIDDKCNYNNNRGEGRTALMDAVESRSVECVRLLLEKGTDACKGSPRHSRTPLHCLATPFPYTLGRESNTKEILDMLLAAGAD